MRQKIARCICAVLLAFMVSVQPFVCVKKADAFAPAVGAAAAAGALAAELGITTEALMTGLLCVTAAGTGIYLLNSADTSLGETYGNLNDAQWRNLWNGNDVTIPNDSNFGLDYQHWRLGNGKSWDELTDDEKANWDTPAEYVQGQWLGYLLGTGLISEVSGGGGFEPTPEPDKNTDPDGNSKWYKLRNTLTVLGVAGGAVALDQGVNALAENIAGGIKGLIFGSDNFGYEWNVDYTIADQNVRFAQPPLSSWVIFVRNNKDIYANDFDCFAIKNSNGTKQYYTGRANNSVGVYECPTCTFTQQLDGHWMSNVGACMFSYNLRTNGVSDKGTATGVQLNVGTGYNDLLVNNYKGSYVFGDFGTYTNGVWTSGNPQKNVDLPYMDGTPSWIPTYIDDSSNYNNYITNITNPEGGGITGITVPENLNDVEYDDIVKVKQDEDITDIPDDEPVTPPDPNPNPDPDPDPNPGPTKPDNYDDDFTNTANRLLSNPFDQLFPFCLISDLRDLTFLLLGGGQVPTSRLQPGTLNMQSNTPTSELNGVHKLTIDFRQSFEGFYYEIPLDPLHDLLRYTRFTLTAAAIMLIVIESFNFFLKRGA